MLPLQGPTGKCEQWPLCGLNNFQRQLITSKMLSELYAVYQNVQPRVDQVQVTTHELDPTAPIPLDDVHHLQQNVQNTSSASVSTLSTNTTVKDVQQTSGDTTQAEIHQGEFKDTNSDIVVVS